MKLLIDIPLAWTFDVPETRAELQVETELILNDVLVPRLNIPVGKITVEEVE